MGILRNIVTAIKYGEEVEQYAKDRRVKREEARKQAEAKRLNLCYEHRQESNRSHFSKGNCDYCRLLQRVADLEKQKMKH